MDFTNKQENIKEGTIVTSIADSQHTLTITPGHSHQKQVVSILQSKIFNVC